MIKLEAINCKRLVAFVLSIFEKASNSINEKLEKLNCQKKTVTEKKLIAARHREKQLEHEQKRLTRSERTHWLLFVPE